jgi:acetyltransferase-like isoleucine patch superfamily enzyme
MAVPAEARCAGAPSGVFAAGALAMLSIADSARISPLADIEDSTRGTKITIAEGVVIDSFVKIKPAGGTGDVFIGANTVINSGTVIYTGNGVTIGCNVAVAANCTFASTNHEYRSRAKLIREQGFMPSRGGIVVEDDVWIGANVVLLDGAIVRRGAVVAAGSVVNGEVPPYSVGAGRPIQTVGYRK